MILPDIMIPVTIALFYSYVKNLLMFSHEIPAQPDIVRRCPCGWLGV